MVHLFELHSTNQHKENKINLPYVAHFCRLGTTDQRIENLPYVVHFYGLGTP